MIKFVKDTLNDPGLMAIINIGSQLFSENPVDIDVLCITDTPESTRRFKVKNGNIVYDLLVISYKELEASILMEQDVVHHSIYNYTHASQNTVWSRSDFIYPEFNMLDENIKLKYLRRVSKYFMNSLYNINRKYEFSKFFTHYYIILSIYKNNSVEYTDKMIEELDMIRSKTGNYQELVDKITTDVEEVYYSVFDKIVEYPNQRNKGIFYQDDQTISERDGDLLFLRDQLFSELQYDFKNHQLTLILDTVEYNIIEVELTDYSLSDIYIYISTNFDKDLNNIGSSSKIVGWNINEITEY